MVAVFWDLEPCNLVEIDKLFGAIALMLEAVNISETSVNLYATSRCNIPEDIHLHIRRCENLKSHLHVVSFLFSLHCVN
jgi:hypothetical protein